MSSIPALSHLNTLFPASKRRPQRVPERLEPLHGETGMGRCSPSRGARVRPLESGKGREGEQAGSAPGRGAPPLLTLLTLLRLLCLPPHGARSPPERSARGRKETGKEEKAESSGEGSIPQRSEMD